MIGSGLRKAMLGVALGGVALLATGAAEAVRHETAQQQRTPEEMARDYEAFITERCSMVSGGIPLDIEVDIARTAQPDFAPGLIDGLINSWGDWTDDAYILVRMHGPTRDGQYISGYTLAPMTTSQITSPDDNLVIECGTQSSPCMPTDWVFSDPSVAQRYDSPIERTGRSRNYIALTCHQPNRVHFAFNAWVRMVSENP